MATICATAARATFSHVPARAIASHRLGNGSDIAAADYGARLSVGDTVISLHPAGHILGSAQVRIEHGGQVWVVSGDYKRQPDPTCAPFETVECDVFISEATFALPVYRWPATPEVAQDILKWWHANRERGIASVLFCYAPRQGAARARGAEGIYG